MRTASPPIPRRRRPHPARRARKIAGAVSVAGMVLLTGCMAVAGKTTGTAATTATSATTATTGHDHRDHPHDDDSDDTTTPTTTTSRSIHAGAAAGATLGAVRHVDQCQLNQSAAPRREIGHFRAMGTDAHVIVVGGPPAPPATRTGSHRRSRTPLEPLRRRQRDQHAQPLRGRAGRRCRPRPSSSCDARSTRGVSRTGGSIPPCSARCCARVTTGRSRRSGPRPRAGSSDLTLGAAAIEIVDNIVRLPAGTGFDPGGIGKGLAADIVADELQAAGAQRRVRQPRRRRARRAARTPTATRGPIAVDHPGAPTRSRGSASPSGAAATSTTLRRRWLVDGEPRHHLIDPATGQPSTSDLTFVTVVAGLRVGGRGARQGGAARRARRTTSTSSRRRAPKRIAIDDARSGHGDGRHVGLSRRTPNCRRRFDERPRARGGGVMSDTLPWYVARAAGLVGWGLLAAATLWGLALSTKVLGKRPRPNWLLDLHRWLGGVALVFTGVHVVALLADTYVHFGVDERARAVRVELAPGRGRVGRRRLLPVGRRGAHLSGPCAPPEDRVAPRPLRQLRCCS